MSFFPIWLFLLFQPFCDFQMLEQFLFLVYSLLSLFKLDYFYSQLKMSGFFFGVPDFLYFCISAPVFDCTLKVSGAKWYFHDLLSKPFKNKALYCLLQLQWSLNIIHLEGHCSPAFSALFPGDASDWLLRIVNHLPESIELLFLQCFHWQAWLPCILKLSYLD